MNLQFKLPTNMDYIPAILQSHWVVIVQLLCVITQLDLLKFCKKIGRPKKIYGRTEREFVKLTVVDVNLLVPLNVLWD